MLKLWKRDFISTRSGGYLWAMLLYFGLLSLNRAMGLGGLHTLAVLYACVFALVPLIRDEYMFRHQLMQSLPTRRGMLALHRYIFTWTVAFGLTAVLLLYVDLLVDLWPRPGMVPLSPQLLLLTAVVISLIIGCVVPPVLRLGLVWGLLAGSTLLAALHLMLFACVRHGYGTEPLLAQLDGFGLYSRWLAWLESMWRPPVVTALLLALLLWNALAAALAVYGYSKREV
ncbi:MAG: hypothetical protein K8R90_10495 [Candidatus Cloacimonetes bacterium]|nr:hypothetical protein [Candidatus Cloacimonadota bacterium]